MQKHSSSPLLLLSLIFVFLTHWIKSLLWPSLCWWLWKDELLWFWWVLFLFFCWVWMKCVLRHRITDSVNGVWWVWREHHRGCFWSIKKDLSLKGFFPKCCQTQITIWACRWQKQALRRTLTMSNFLQLVLWFTAAAVLLHIGAISKSVISTTQTQNRCK